MRIHKPDNHKRLTERSPAEEIVSILMPGSDSSETAEPNRSVVPESVSPEAGAVSTEAVAAEPVSPGEGPSSAVCMTRRFPLTALLWFAGMLLLSVPMVTLIDIPIARWFAADPLPREMGNALELMRIFSHGSGIGLILIGIFMMAPESRWQLPRLAALAVGAGAVATLAKMFVLRPRPTGLNLDVASIDSAWLWAFDWSLSQVAMFDASTRAFPSGNMATAIALTVGLWGVIPRGRWLFAAICLGTFVQRLACGAHFPSDVLGGAAFGLIWAYVCVHPKLLGNLFDKMQPETTPRRRRRMAETELAAQVPAAQVPAKQTPAAPTPLPPRKIAS